MCLHLLHCVWPPAPNSVRWTGGWCVDTAARSQASSSERHELRPAEPPPGSHTPEYKVTNMSKNDIECQKEMYKMRNVCVFNSRVDWLETVCLVRVQLLPFSSILILHFITVNHGVITLITNEISTLEAFTDTQSHGSSELGAACWVTMNPLREIVEFMQNIGLKQSLKKCICFIPTYSSSCIFTDYCVLEKNQSWDLFSLLFFQIYFVLLHQIKGKSFQIKIIINVH